MTWAESFPASISPDCQLLILGSMPGIRSLEAQEYYAHPRNAFWPIMCELFSIPADLAYAQKLQALKDSRIGLWDVYQSCFRPGSLDADIDTDSARFNDILWVGRRCPGLETIVFNGKAAEKGFYKYLKSLGAEERDELERCERLVLPSTSPANAALSRQEKLEAWRDVMQRLNVNRTGE